MRALAASLAVLVACSGGGHHATPTPPAPPPTPDAAPAPPPDAAAPVAPPIALPAGVPDTVAGHQLAWVLDVVRARKGVLDRAEVVAHFHPSFLAQVPVDQTIAVFGQLGAQLADLAVTSVDAKGDLELIAHTTASGQRLRVVLSVDAASRLISGLLLQADPLPPPPLASWDDAQKLVGSLAPHASLEVADLDGKGACKPRHELHPTDELAIGSAFKLYVLLGLADRLDAKKAAWTDELAVRDDWKSLPSGTTQADAAGTKLTLKTFAERMISISDNTAADHLLYLLGRPAVEAALREARHARPALDTPFLATRELFVLKLGDAAARDAYLKLPAAKRRAYLDKTLAGAAPTLDGVADWKTARAIDRLEWFASGRDLCNVMGTLWARAQRPTSAGVLDVLAINIALPLDRAPWKYIGFKGGSEPGVIDLTYLLQRQDGHWMVVSMTWNSDEGGALDEDQIFAAATGVVKLAADASVK